MSKGKSSRSLAAGTKVRVKPGVSIPEFPDVSCAGWTGTVVETSGKAADLKCVIEWDESVVASMPAAYVKQCEEKQFYYRMACLRGDDLETQG